MGLRLALRTLRSGELTLLVAALALAVAAMATVGVFTDRTRLALEREANRLLGADLVFTSTRALAPGLREEAQRRGLRAIATLGFRSMVVRGDQQLLAEITAVEPGYPLRGATRVARERGGPEEIPSSIPERATLWADERLLGRLGVEVGDAVALGEQRFTIGALLTQDPSLTLSVLGMGPRLIMSTADVEATGLVVPGSRVLHRLLVAGDGERIDAYRAWARARLDRGVRLEGVRDARPELRAALERADRFMGLAALAAVVLAAVAVLLAARRFYDRQLDVCAVMRCLGASQWRVFRLELVQLISAGVAAGIAGSALGLVAQGVLGRLLTATIGIELPMPGIGSALRAAALGLVLLLAFALPPLLGLRHVPALRVLRRELGAPRAGVVAGFIVGILAVAALVVWHARDLRLAAYVLAGCAGTVVAAALVTRAVLAGLSRASAAATSSWRYGIAALRRRQASTLWQVLALSLGLTAVLTLTLVRTDLLRSWQASLPADAPNRFLVNIQPDQVDAVGALLAARLGARPPIHPMVRGRLVAINGSEVRSDQFAEERARRLVEREFNLTWGERLPADNRVIAGLWHGSAAAARQSLSVEEGIARTLGIRLGDQLTYDVAGRRFDAAVASLRRVEWDSLRANFFVIAAPGLLEDYPATYITSFHLPADRNAVLAEVVRSFPSVVVIDVDALLGQVQAMIAQVSKAVQFVFVFTLAAGMLVLYAGVVATHDERIREVAIMRTLGANRRHVTCAYAVEFAVIGAMAGLLAAAGASASGYALAAQVLNLPYSFDPSLWALGLGLGIAGTGAAGLWFTHRILATPPLVSLRELG